MSDGGADIVHAGPIGLDFAALTAEGVASLQRLCGEIWTDYNLHDPGVTILEQLVYGLTDLAYRTEFPVADYLTGPDGGIDYQAQGLYPPAAIFAGQALTANDYRRLLYDAIPTLEEVWVHPMGNGLLAIKVAGNGERLQAAESGELERLVRRHYAAHRGLCEDLGQVTVLEPVPCYLSGAIDTCGDRSPADILAQVLFECGNYMSSGLAVRRLQDVVGEGMLPEQVYDGPALEHGYVTSSAAPPLVRRITISELIGIIQKIEGVSRVRGLAFRDAGFHATDEVVCDTSGGSYPCLPFPPEAMWDWLQLQPLQGREADAAAPAHGEATRQAKNRALHAEAAHELKKLHFYRHAFRTERNEPDAVFPMPTGQHRALAEYYSVQNDFPAVYGIGQYGVPHSAGIERKKQARQLKGYLFPFEQMMANYLQNLQDLPTLFSVTERGAASYCSQWLGDEAIPHIEGLYTNRDEPDFAALAAQDNYFDRKGRLFDYLLALYGEAFPQTALRRFNHYHRADTERWLLDAKARLVQDLVDLSARRGIAADYLAGAHSISRLQQRVAILIGLRSAGAARRPTAPWIGEQPLAQPEGRARQAGWASISPIAGSAGALEAIELPGHAYRLALFHNGLALENYATAAEGGQVALYCNGGERWFELGRYQDRAQAAAAGHAFVRAFVYANEAAEGLDIIEHILLRPRGGAPLQAQFYAARFSVVMPSWTARCADAEFRHFVQETVAAHCPAHLQPTFLWLAPDRMAAYEPLRDGWRSALAALHEAGAGQQEQKQSACNDAARQLAAFLAMQARRAQ